MSHSVTSANFLPELKVKLDKLIYTQNLPNLPKNMPHAFIYHISIENHSKRNIMLFGRKWIIRESSGQYRIVEGDGIVGETPRLAPGQGFAYQSFHVTGIDSQVTGAYYGVDETGLPIYTTVPTFSLKIPGG